jgi:broad specificity phosphatase PhoE
VKVPPTPPEPPFSVRTPFLIGRTDVTRLTLVRHAQQDYPDTDEFDHSAWVDPPLSGLGQVQAYAVAALLGEEDVDVVACSTMQRAMDTAEIIASPHDLTPIVNVELREIDSYRDIPKTVNPQDLVPPEDWARNEELWQTTVNWDLMFFGETSAQFRARAIGAIDELIAEHRGKHIVLVSHGGVINAFLASILGIADDMFFLPHHCSISTVVASEDRLRVHSINEHQHLHVGILTN